MKNRLTIPTILISLFLLLAGCSPQPIESSRDFAVEIEKPQFRLIYNLQVIYEPKNSDLANELTDINLQVSLVSKKTTVVQTKTIQLNRWNKGQAHLLTDYDLEIDGFSLSDYENKNLSIEISGVAKSADRIVRVHEVLNM